MGRTGDERVADGEGEDKVDRGADIMAVEEIIYIPKCSGVIHVDKKFMSTCPLEG